MFLSYINRASKIVLYFPDIDKCRTALYSCFHTKIYTLQGMNLLLKSTYEIYIN